MSMSKKHFEAIAKMINDNIILVGDGKGQILTEDFVRQKVIFCATQNHMFDKERFIEACYKKVREGEAKGKILTVYEFRVMDNKKVD